MPIRGPRSGRNLRVAEQIARLLAGLLSRQIRDPRLGLVTITGCEVSPDLSQARVYFTALGGDEGAASDILNGAAGELRAALFPQLRLRRVPALVFARDDSVARGFAVDRAIAEAVRRSEITEALAEPSGEDGRKS